MKPADVKTNTYIYSSWEISDKNSKFKIDNIVRISNMKIYLQKVHSRLIWRSFCGYKSSKQSAVDIRYWWL